MVFERLLGGDEEVPFKGYGGCEVRFVVRDGEDLFVGAAEGTRVEVDLEALCVEKYISFGLYRLLQLNRNVVRNKKTQSIPSARFTCTSFQNLFVFAVPPPVPPATARKSCPLFSNSACFRRLATRESTCSALGTGAVGGGPEAVMGATVAGLECEVCRHRCRRGDNAHCAEKVREPLVQLVRCDCVIRFIVRDSSCEWDMVDFFDDISLQGVCSVCSVSQEIVLAFELGQWALPLEEFRQDKYR